VKSNSACLMAVVFFCALSGTYARADECDPNDPTLLKPDLVPQPPRDVYVFQGQQGRELEFSTIIGNVGDGPLILQGHTVQTADGTQTQAIQQIWRTDGTMCTHVAGYFIYHPQHQHWHFENFEDYQLRKDDPYTGEIVRRSSKVSFCLLDVLRLPGYTGSTQFRNSCANPEGTEGISVGYADEYEAFLPGQQIELDPDGDTLPPGNYYLVNVVNPGKLIWEKNDDIQSNSGVISVSIGLSNSRRPQGEVLVHQPLEPPVPIHPNLSATPPAPPAVKKKPTPPPSRVGVVRHQPHAPHQPGQTTASGDTSAPAKPTPAQSTSSGDASAPAEPTPVTAVVKGPHQPHAPHQPHQ
jgi:hypothetical protein